MRYSALAPAFAAIAFSAMPAFAQTAAAPAAAPADAAADVAVDEVMKMHYVCEGDATLDAIFLNTTSGASFALISHNDKPVLMEVSESADGARYISEPVDDEDGGPGVQLELWTKGMTATFSQLDGDEATPLLKGCDAEHADG